MGNTVKGLGLTAEPSRCDGKGFGRHAHGVFDVIVPNKKNARWLINNGFLVDYRIIAPTTPIDLSNVPIGASGDYVLQKLRDAHHKSTIVGDTVKNYIKLAKGEKTIVFTVDIESAMECAAKFREAGIKALPLHSRTPGKRRTTVTTAVRSG